MRDSPKRQKQIIKDHLKQMEDFNSDNAGFTNIYIVTSDAKTIAKAKKAYAIRQRSINKRLKAKK